MDARPAGGGGAQDPALLPFHVELPKLGQLEPHDYGYMFRKRPQTQQQQRSRHSALSSRYASSPASATPSRRHCSPTQSGNTPTRPQTSHHAQQLQHPVDCTAWFSGSGQGADLRASWPLPAPATPTCSTQGHQTGFCMPSQKTASHAATHFAPCIPAELQHINQQQPLPVSAHESNGISRPPASPAHGRFSRQIDGLLAGGKSADHLAPEPETSSKGPDPRAMKWFREQFPSVIPTPQRADALTVLHFLESHLGQLYEALTGGSCLGASGSRPSSPVNLPYSSRSSSSYGARSPGRSAAGMEASGYGEDPLASVGTAPPSPSLRASTPSSGLPSAPLPDILGPLRDSVLLVRDPSGFLNPSILSHQEELFSRCMGELCGQVAVACLERGFLIHQLWQALRYLMHAVIADRDLAWSIAHEARRKQQAGIDAVAAATLQLRTEKEEQARMNDALNKRLVTRQAENERHKAKVSELQAQLGGLAGIQPEVLRQQVADQNEALLATQKQVVALNVRLDRATAELAAKDKEMQLLANRIVEIQADLETTSAEMHARTPRPAQPSQPPWDLLTIDQTTLAIRALREGCSPEDLHRLLIGVSANGIDILPFIDLLGCCRSINIHAPGPQDGEAHDTDEPQSQSATPQGGGGGHGTSPNRPARAPAGAAAGASSSEHNTTNLSSVVRTPGRAGSGWNDAASVASRSEAPVLRRQMSAWSGVCHTQGEGGAKGGGGTAGPGTATAPSTARQQARRVLASLTTPDQPLPELQEFLRDLLAQHQVPLLLPYLKESVVQSVSQMLNHGADVESVACLLTGCMSPGGAEVTRFKALAGVLSARMKQEASDVGGPITEALALACGSTFDRVLCLEKSLLLQRRRALKATWMMDEQRRQEGCQRTLEGLRAARRVQLPVHPVQTILSERQLDFFNGLGTAENIPAVLRYEGKVYHSDMDRREAVRLVRSLWTAKSELEASTGLRQLLPDFLSDFMLKKYATPHRVAQTIYNLLSTAAQHPYDPELLLFLKAFLGELEDTLYEDQQRQVEQIRAALKQQDLDLNQQVTGWLPKGELRGCLQRVMPFMTDMQLKQLTDAVESDEPDALFKHEHLLQENIDGHCGMFFDVLRHQSIQEALHFHQSIHEALLDAVEKANPESPVITEATVTPNMVLAAMATAHPQLGPDRVEELLRRVYGKELASVMRPTPESWALAAKAKGGKAKPLLALVDVLRLLREPPCDRPVEIIPKTKKKSRGVADTKTRPKNRVALPV